MAWGMNLNGMKNIHSFADAHRHFTDTPGWKNENGVPLQDRRKKHVRLVMAGDTYRCKLYQTDIVEYHKDGGFELRTFDTRSTGEFAWYVRPDGWTPVMHRGCMYWKHDDQHYRGHIEVNADGEITNAGQEITELRLDKEAAKEARAKLKPFLVWLETTRRIAPNSWNSLPPNVWGSWEPLLRSPDDITLFPQYARRAWSSDRAIIYKKVYADMRLYKASLTEGRALPRKVS